MRIQFNNYNNVYFQIEHITLGQYLFINNWDMYEIRCLRRTNGLETSSLVIIFYHFINRSRSVIRRQSKPIT